MESRSHRVYRYLSTDPRAVSLSLGLFFFLLYARTATPGFVVGWIAENDSAEIQRAVVRLGIIHPTGYPSYTLLAYLFTRIGVLLQDNPFVWVTYFSSFTVAASVSLFYLTFRHWFTSAAALTAACTIGFSGVVWHIATIAEVQGLHLLLIAAVFYLAVRFDEQPHQLILLEMIALLFGIGLGNHRLILLAAPPVALIVLRHYPLRRLGIWGHVRLLAMLGFPLLSYYYIFYSAAGTSLSGETPTVYQLGSVYDHLDSPYKALEVVMGYGQMDVFIIPDSINQALDQLGQIIDYHVESLTLPGVVLAGIGLLIFARRQPFFGASFMVLLSLHVIFFMLWRIEKGFIYYGVTIYVLGVGVGAVADSVITFVSGISARIPRQIPALAVASCSLVLFGVQLDNNNRSGDRRGDEIYQAYLDLPADSLVFTGGYGPEHFIGLEAQTVRDDLTLDPVGSTERIISAARTTSQAVFLSFRIQQYLQMLTGATVFPEAGLALAGTTSDFIQVCPHHDERLREEADKAEILDRSITPGIRLYSYRVALEDEGVLVTLFWEAEQLIPGDYRPFTHLRLISEDGSVLALLSQRDYPNPVRNMYPTRYWQVGEMVRDTYLVPWPDESLPPAGKLRLAFGFTNEVGERLGEVSVFFRKTPESEFPQSY